MRQPNAIIIQHCFRWSQSYVGCMASEQGYMFPGHELYADISSAITGYYKPFRDDYLVATSRWGGGRRMTFYRIPDLDSSYTMESKGPLWIRGQDIQFM
ncbi:hypothetical protein ABZY09_03315 [Streptomyces sp. NPDC002928]|uniref:hypothetical protein n=1 Tax=Streptomyces sp. NPDC002928 TaxID=3154440 RepID=UPI0033A4BE18